MTAGRIDTKEPWWEKTSAPNMKTIESAEQLITELVSRQRDKSTACDGMVVT